MAARMLFIAVSCTALSFAGVAWKGTLTSKSDGKETVTVMDGYAQKGNVREEFAEVRGETGMNKGDFIIYRSDKNVMYIVDTKEKHYMEMPLDAMGSLMGGMMEIKISNPKVSAKSAGSEKVGGFNCSKVIITSTYDMEMKVMFMTTKSHVEQTQEIWATKDVALAEIGEAYRGRAAKTGMKSLDTLIMKESQAVGMRGFPIKTVTTQKSTSDGKTSITASTYTIESIAQKALSADLFTVPAGYSKASMPTAGTAGASEKSSAAKPASSKTKGKSDDEDEAKKAEQAAKDIMKSLFK